MISGRTAGTAKIILAVDKNRLGADLDKAQGRLRQFAQSVKAMSGKLTMIGALAQYPIRNAINTFATFDDQMRMVAAVTGEVGDGFKSLNDQARELGRSTSYTAREVAGAMTELARMGFSSAEIKSAVPDVMNLARATGTDLSEAALIAANNMRVFGLDASKMTDVADIMTVTANRSAQTLSDLGESLKMAAPQAARFKETLIDTAASLGVLANMGIRGSMAGTALSRSFTQMVKPEVQEKLAGLGISVQDANGNLRKMKDILTDVAIAMSSMGTADAGKLVKDIFDVRGSLGGGVIAANIEQIQKMSAELKRFQGESSRVAGEIDRGAGGSIRRLTSAFESLAISMGNIFADALAPAIQGLTNFSQRIEKFAEKFSYIIRPATQAAVSIIAIGVAIRGLGAMVWVFKALASPLVLFNKTLLSVGASMRVAGRSAYAMAQPIKLITIAQNGSIISGQRAIASNYAYRASLAAVTASAKAAGVAIGGFLKANAIGLLITGVVALYSWHSSKLAKLQAEVEATAEAMKKAADDARAATDLRKDENRGAWDKFSRLQQFEALSKLRDLTVDEIKQVNTLKSALDGFGSGGFAHIDESAKAFNLAADAVDRMTDALRENAIAGIEGEKQVVESQIKQLREELARKKEEDAKLTDALSQYYPQGVANPKLTDWIAPGVLEDMESIRELYKQLGELDARIASMRTGSIADAVGGGFDELQNRIVTTAEELAELEKAATKAAEEIERVYGEEFRRSLSPVERELAEIGDIEKKYHDALKVKRDFLLAGANAAQAAGSRDEVSRIVDEIRAIDKQAEAFDRLTEARKKTIAEANRSDQEKFLAEADRLFAGKQVEDAGDRVFGKLSKAGDFGTLENFMSSFRGGIAGMRSAYAAMLQASTSPDSEAGSYLSEAEISSLKEMGQAITRAMDKFGEYSQRLADAREGTHAAMERMSQGTYAVDRFFARSGLGGQSDAKRTAVASEQTNVKLEQLYRWMTENNVPLVIGG